MGPNDRLIAKWRDKYEKGGFPEEVLDPANLQPSSFCAMYTGEVNSPVGSGSYAVILDGAADFVAFLREAQLPWDFLRAAGFVAKAGSVKAYLDELDGEPRALLRNCLAVLNEILSRDGISSDDAARAIAAYNPVFCFGDSLYESTFEAYGTIAEVLNTMDLEDLDDETIRQTAEWFRKTCGATITDGGMLAERELARLVNTGTFDPEKPEHLQIARDVLWERQREMAPNWKPDWDRYRSTQAGDPPGPGPDA